MKLALLLGVAVAVFGATYACSCAPYDPKHNPLCTAQWISHVNVTGATTDAEGFSVFYTVQHLLTYKAPPELTNGLFTTIKTGAQSAMCGVTLDVGQDYLLTGGAGDQVLFISLCQNIYTNITDLPTEQRELLEHPDKCPKKGVKTPTTPETTTAAPTRPTTTPFTTRLTTRTERPTTTPVPAAPTATTPNFVRPPFTVGPIRPVVPAGVPTRTGLPNLGQVIQATTSPVQSTTNF